MLGDTTVGVLFRLRAETKEAQAEIADFRGKVTSQLKTLLDVIPGGDKVSELAGKFGELTKTVATVPDAVGNAATGLGMFLAATTGLLATVGAAIGLVAGLGAVLFGLATFAAQTGTQLHELSVQTGFSVETFSALREVSRDTRVPLEDIAASFQKLDRLIGQAAQGIPAATDKLKRFGVEGKDAIIDQDAALAKIFDKINSLPPGIQRVIAAQDAFGRSGAKMVEVIEKTGGNFEKFKQEAKAAGKVIGEDAAREADEFTDRLRKLEGQAGKAARTFGMELIPAINQALEDLGAALGGNLVDWKKWGQDVAEIIAGVAGGVREVIAQIKQNQQKGGKDFDNFFDNYDRGFHQGVDRLHQRQTENPHELRDAFRAQIEQYRKEGKEPPQDVIDSYRRQLMGDGGGDYFTGKAGTGKEAEKARQEAIRKLEGDLSEIEALYKVHNDELQREYDLGAISSQTYTRQIIADADKRLADRLAKLDQELALVKKGSEAQKVQSEKRRAQEDRDREVQQAQDAQDAREIESLKKHREALLDLADRYDKMKIRSTGEMERIGAISAQQSEDITYDIQTKAWNRRVQALSDDWTAYNEKAKDGSEINLEVTREFSDQMDGLYQEQEDRQQEHERRTDAITVEEERKAKEHARTLADINRDATSANLERQALELSQTSRYLFTKTELIRQERDLETARAEAEWETRKAEIKARRDDLLERETDEQKKLEIKAAYNHLLEEEELRHSAELEEIRRTYQREEDAENPLSGISLFGDAAQDALDTGGSMWTAFGETVSAALSQASASAGNFGTIIGGVFAGISNAIGQSIKNWVLLGNLGGQSFRKFTAEILAGVAAQAAIKAVWELAEGFAALATPWTAWQAPFHFHAAALYGTVAAVAAVTGRLVAGNAFQTSSAGAGGGTGAGGGGGSGTSTGTPQPQTIEQDRRQVVEHVIILRPERGWVAEHFVQDMRNNGQTRTEIQNLTGVPAP